MFAFLSLQLSLLVAQEKIVKIAVPDPITSMTHNFEG